MTPQLLDVAELPVELKFVRMFRACMQIFFATTNTFVATRQLLLKQLS